MLVIGSNNYVPIRIINRAKHVWVNIGNQNLTRLSENVHKIWVHSECMPAKNLQNNWVHISYIIYYTF